jgi:hypothetical protein
MLSMHFLNLTVGATAHGGAQPLPRVVKSTGNPQPSLRRGVNPGARRD